MTPPIKTICPYCGVGCGLEVQRDPVGVVSVRGDPEHPANRGRLCSKGAALAETLGLEGRLLHPEIQGRRVPWGRALDAVAEGLRDTIERHGPEAVAFYVSGQLLTEDYYVANKLMKGFIGSANIDTNSRLCMSSSVAGHKRAFGSDSVPGCYEDLEQADLLVLVGSNAAWCHPVLFQRIRAAREQRPGLRVVVIDPRRTDTCDIADLHLPLAPSSDIALFNGLLHTSVIFLLFFPQIDICSRIPNNDGSSTIFILWNNTLEICIFHRMIFGGDCEPFFPRIGRGPLRHGPGLKNSIHFESKVVVQMAGIMLLNNENRLVRRLPVFFSGTARELVFLGAHHPANRIVIVLAAGRTGQIDGFGLLLLDVKLPFIHDVPALS